MKKKKKSINRIQEMLHKKKGKMQPSTKHMLMLMFLTLLTFIDLDSFELIRVDNGQTAHRLLSTLSFP